MWWTRSSTAAPRQHQYYYHPYHDSIRAQPLSYSQQELMSLPQDFECPHCLHSLAKGSVVNIIGKHRIGRKDRGDGYIIIADFDSVSVVCPKCENCSIQCCHCSKTCMKDKPHRNQVMVFKKALHSRNYAAHYKEHHSGR